MKAVINLRTKGDIHDLTNCSLTNVYLARNQHSNWKLNEIFEWLFCSYSMAIVYFPSLSFFNFLSWKTTNSTMTLLDLNQWPLLYDDIHLSEYCDSKMWKINIESTPNGRLHIFQLWNRWSRRKETQKQADFIVGVCVALYNGYWN